MYNRLILIIIYIYADENPPFNSLLWGMLRLAPIISLWPSPTVICKHTPKPNLKIYNLYTNLSASHYTCHENWSSWNGLLRNLSWHTFLLLIFSQALLQIYEVGPSHVLYIHHSGIADSAIKYTTTKGNLIFRIGSPYNLREGVLIKSFGSANHIVIGPNSSQ